MTYKLPEAYEKVHHVRAPILGWLLSILPAVFFFSILCWVILTFFNEKSKSTIQGLEKKLESERERNELIANNIEQLFNGVLMQLSSVLHFSHNDERVTLYIHDGNQTFVICGRYSLDPEYRKKTRPEFPDNQGCINRGWRQGWFFDNEFGTTDDAHKRKCLETYQIPEDIYNNIGMKSRLYAVKVLRNRITSQPMAVIVVESLSGDRFTEAQLSTTLNEQESYLAEMVMNLSQYIPTPNQAREKGF